MTEQPLKIIGLCGRAGVGKDEIARYLTAEHNFEQIALAWPLKDMLQALPEILEFDLEDRQKKELPNPFYEISPRKMMQTLGDWGRELRSDFWIRLAQLHIERIKIYNRNLETFGYIGGIVVSDCRMENELAWIRSIGGHVWHIYRGQSTQVNPHKTEQIQLPGLGDAICLNDGTIEDLHAWIELEL